MTEPTTTITIPTRVLDALERAQLAQSVAVSQLSIDPARSSGIAEWQALHDAQCALWDAYRSLVRSVETGPLIRAAIDAELYVADRISRHAELLEILRGVQ
ncbi:hypothetical protein [Saccharopolyspora sp. CA-218241]|uniref:hypothetical protein n=1 Tax=Saccharopolyspora sp. CA-218241 TaxID=3240027 RepID=UPI003D9607A6